MGFLVRETIRKKIRCSSWMKKRIVADAGKSPDPNPNPLLPHALAPELSSSSIQEVKALQQTKRIY